MSNSLKDSSLKVKEALSAYDYDVEIINFDDSTRTAIDAANTIGCEVSQIVKSLIFKGKTSNSPILIVASGPNRVNTKAVSKYIGEKLGKADADFVRENTGFAIGGVPPIGLFKPIKTIIDEDLINLDEIWAAAGTPNSVFKLTPVILQNITSGEVMCIK